VIALISGGSIAAVASGIAVVVVDLVVVALIVRTGDSPILVHAVVVTVGVVIGSVIAPVHRRGTSGR
jgi:hypothetical protein